MRQCVLPPLLLLCVMQQAFAGALTPPGNLSDVVITGGTIAGANASNALVSTRSGGLSTTISNRLATWCDPVADYGADPSGAGDSAAAINACLSSGAPTKLPAGNYLISSGPVVMKAGSVLQGAGVGITTLTLGAAKNSDVIQTAGADSWVGTNVQQGINDWSVSDLTINGNAPAQTVSGASRDLANGITAYGWHWRLSNLLIENVVGNGVRTDAYAAGPSSLGSEAESHVDRVTIDTANRHGWWNNAPWTSGHDVVVVNAGQEADRSYDAFYFTAGGDFDALSAWYRTASTAPLRVAYDLYTKGGVNIANSKFAGGGLGWVYHGGGGTLQSVGDRIANSVFTADAGSANSGGELFAGNGNSAIGNQYFCNSSGSGTLDVAGVDVYALQIGVSGGTAAAYNRVANAVFMGCSDLSPVDLQNSGGFNAISGVSDGSANGATSIGGTQASSDSVSIGQSNTTLATTQDFSANSRLTGATVGVFIGGGGGHSASGDFNVIAGGSGNAVSGSYSAIPGGKDSNDRGVNGRLCFESGTDISNPGDHQVCWQTLVGALSAAGSVEMLTGADQTAASASDTLTLPGDDLAYGFSCEVNVIDTATGDAGQFYVDHAMIARATGAASVTLDGASTPLALSHGVLGGALTGGGLSVTASPDTTLGGLNLTATETAALPLHFSAVCETREVQ